MKVLARNPRLDGTRAVRTLLALGSLVACDPGLKGRGDPGGNGVGGAFGTDGAGSSGGGGGGVSVPFHVLLFSRTTGFRHESIPDAVETLTALQVEGGYVADATEDPTRFSAAGLAPYDVVVFLMTTGDVLDDTQQTAFEAWVHAGGGYVGVHSATDTEYDWSFYGRLVGAYFHDHPAVQEATVRVERADHPATTAMPAVWTHTDEWYNFAVNPRATVTVLATVDESTYAGGTMGADHPVVWCHTAEGGRAFYTAMGHTSETWSEPVFRQHLIGALRWAARRE